MNYKYSLFFFLIITLASCTSVDKIAPSKEVKNAPPAYWTDGSVTNSTHTECDGDYELPTVIGGIAKLEDRITFPNDGNKYNQRITAAFFVTPKGKADKIWFPYHTKSIATAAVKKALLASEFRPLICKGKRKATKFAVTVRAKN